MFKIGVHWSEHNFLQPFSYQNLEKIGCIGNWLRGLEQHPNRLLDHVQQHYFLGSDRVPEGSLAENNWSRGVKNLLRSLHTIDKGSSGVPWAIGRRWIVNLGFPELWHAELH